MPTLPWEIFAEHLRTELQSYGTLLQLFDEQQTNMLRRNANAVLALGQEIEATAQVTAEHRSRREMIFAQLALSVGCDPATPLRKLLPYFTAEVRPLLTALLDELHHLIHRVRRGAHRNHELLTRTLQLQQETLNTLRPAGFVQTYSPHGQISSTTPEGAWRVAG